MTSYHNLKRALWLALAGVVAVTTFLGLVALRR